MLGFEIAKEIYQGIEINLKRNSWYFSSLNLRMFFEKTIERGFWNSDFGMFRSFFDCQPHYFISSNKLSRGTPVFFAILRAVLTEKHCFLLKNFDNDASEIPRKIANCFWLNPFSLINSLRFLGGFFFGNINFLIIFIILNYNISKNFTFVKSFLKKNFIILRKC